METTSTTPATTFKFGSEFIKEVYKKGEENAIKFLDGYKPYNYTPETFKTSSDVMKVEDKMTIEVAKTKFAELSKIAQEKFSKTKEKSSKHLDFVFFDGKAFVSRIRYNTKTNKFNQWELYTVNDTTEYTIVIFDVEELGKYKPTKASASKK